MKHLFLIGFLTALGIWAADHYVVDQNQRDERRNAMFYIEVNDSRPEIPEPSIDAGAIMDNEYRNVVHVRGEVTWREFLNSHNIGAEEINRTHYCVNINETSCGRGILALNGERTAGDTVIEQGDVMALVIGEDAHETAEDYSARQLPRRFKKIAVSGERA